MPFIQRESISPNIKRPYEVAYKASLRKALTNPGLTVDQRQQIKDQMQELGKSKIYTKNSIPKPGAISFQEPIPPRELLKRLSKEELILLAKQLNIPVTGNKNQILEALLASSISQS